MTNENLYNQVIFALNNRTTLHSLDDLLSLTRYYKDNAIVYGLVDWKASRMSEIQPNLFKVKDKESAKEFRKFNGKYVEAYELKELSKLKKKAYEEIDLDEISINDITYGKIKQLLKKPNELQSWKSFIYHYSAGKDVSGFQPIWGNRLDFGLNKGKYNELRCLPSHLVEIVGGGIFEPIRGYRVKLHDWTKEFLNEDVLLLSNHSFDFNLSGSQLYGTSRVRAALKELDTFKYSKERELYSYQTGDAQTILFPKELQVAESMNDETNKPMVQKWIDSVRKILKQKTRDGISVAPYSLDSIKVGTALKDTNTGESQEKAIANICGVWHINPIIIGQNATNTDSKIKEVSKMALRDAVFPEARELCEGLNDWWLQPQYKGLELQFDYEVFEEFSQDLQSKAQALKDIDVLSDNEKRTDWLGYDRIEDDRADMPQKYWEPDIQPLNFDYNEPE